MLVGFRRDLQLHAGFTLRDIAAQYPAVRPTFGELLEPTVDAKFILTPVLWKYLYRYAVSIRRGVIALVMAWLTPPIPTAWPDAFCPLL